MQPPQNPYNQPPLSNPGGYQPTPPGVTSTTTLIITGILGIICCGLLAPYTWIKSTQAIQTLSSGYGNVADASTYNITRILGIVGTVLWILGIIFRIGTIGSAISASNNANSRPPITVPSNS